MLFGTLLDTITIPLFHSAIVITAVLAAGSPEHVPFMADESVTAVTKITVIKYDLSCYMQFADAIKHKLKWLQETSKYLSVFLLD